MTRSSPTWLVVLNWNGRDDTLELLEGLVAEPATILVVDNGSYDGTLEAVKERFPGVHTLQTGSNLGYAGGNNAGIEHALLQGAAIVGVLNNDTLVEPGFLAPLVAAVESNPRAAVSPDIRYASDPAVSWFRGSFIDERTGWPQHLPPARQPAVDAGTFSSPVLTGCCIVASAAAWREVGLFDDGMFLIFEDSDWSRRAVSRGVELLVVPQSRIRHKVSKSFTGASSLLGSYYYARNGTVFAWRHLGASAALRFAWRAVIRPGLRQCWHQASRRHKTLQAWGVVDAVLHRRGPAGQTVIQYAERTVLVRDRAGSV